MKNLKEITKGAIIAFFGIIISYVLVYLFNIIIARNFGASEVGLYNLGFAILTLASPIIVFGLTRGIQRYLPMQIADKDLRKVRGTLKFVYIFTIILSVAVSSLIFLGSEIIAKEVFNEASLVLIIKIFSFVIPFNVFNSISRSIVLSYKKANYKVIFEDMLLNSTLILLTLLSISLGYSIIGAVTSYLVSLVLVSFLYLIIISKITPLFSSKIKTSYVSKELFSFSYPLMMSSVIIIIIKKMDLLMLGYFTTALNVGIYAIAVKTALLLLIGLNSVQLIFTPMVSNIHKKGEINELSGLFKTTTKWIFSIAYPGLLIILLFSENILSIFGPEFTVGYIALIILGFAQLINSATGTCGVIINMIGKSKITLINQIVVLGLNFFLNIKLIPDFGIIGAAIATATSIAVLNLMRLVEVYYFLRIHPYKRTFLKPIIAGLIAFTSVKFIPLFWIYSLFIFGLLYVSLILLFRLEEEEKTILNLIIKRIRNFI